MNNRIVLVVVACLLTIVSRASAQDIDNGRDDATEQKLLQAKKETDNLDRIQNFLTMMGDAGITAEIELNPDQDSNLQRILLEQRYAIDELRQTNDNGSDRLVQIYSETFDAASEILLPHQIERLGQLYKRRKMLNYGGRTSRYLIENAVPDVELTDGQIRDLDEIRLKYSEQLVEIARTFHGQFTEIRNTEKQQVFDLLDDNQKNQLRAVIGDEYEGAGLDTAILMTLKQYFRQLKNGENGMPAAVTVDDDEAQKVVFILHNIYTDESVIGDLEPTASQLDQIAQAIEQKDEHLDLSREFPGTMEEKVAKFREAETQAYEEINEILLPHQLERVEHLYMRRLLRNSEGSYARYLSTVMNEQLNLTDHQIESMQKCYAASAKIMWVRATEFEQGVVEIFESEKNESLEVLDAEQQETLRQSFGDELTGDRWALGNPVESLMRSFVADYRPEEQKEEENSRMEIPTRDRK